MKVLILKSSVIFFCPNDAIDFIFKTAPLYAKAKGELAQLETFKSSLKAIKMAQTDEQSLGAQERQAYRSQDYQAQEFQRQLRHDPKDRRRSPAL